MQEEQPRKTGGSLQFSIAALLILTTVLAVLFAWWRDRSQLLQRLETERRRALKAEQLVQQLANQAAMERDAATRAAELSREQAKLANETLQALDTAMERARANDPQQTAP